MSHHPFSPSKFPAWEECPCFEGELIEDDDEESNANRGTAQHKAQAMLLTGKPDGWDSGLSSRERANVEWCLNQIVINAAQAGYGAHEIKVEQKLVYFNDSFEPEYFGTCDAEFGPFIEDSKFGLERNYFSQLCGYALAKMQRDGLNKVRCFVAYGMLRRVKHYVIDRETAETVVKRIIASRKDTQRQPKACQYCSWCANKLNCSQFLGKAAMVVPTDNESFDLGHIGGFPEPVKVGVMRYLLKTYIEKWTQAVEDSPCDPVGFKKSVRQGRQYVSDTAKAVRVMLDAGVDRRLVEQALTTTNGKMIDAFQKQYPKCTEDQAKQEVESLLAKAGCLERGESYTVLTKEKNCEDLLRQAIEQHKKLSV